MTLLLIAFVAGLLTVLAPCTLPLLPVIIGGSAGEGNFRRAIVIAGSLGASVFIFTLLLKATTLLISVPQEFWNIVSGGLLIIFGLVTLFPTLWDRFAFAGAINRSSNTLLAQGYTRQNFIGDVIIGAALGPVFSSCSPTYFIVLATVLPVHPAEGVLYLTAYSIGLIISLLVVANIGQRIVTALGIASDPQGWFKRTIGAIFLIIGVIVASGYSTQIESDILSHAGIFDVTQIEQQLLASRSSSAGTSPNSTSTPMGYLTPQEKATQYPKAPELAGIDGYINAPSTSSGQAAPITLASLRGKVVLVDFWTYSCINCLRTLPYLKAWYEKYKDAGFVIVGVHTPEFAFEHVTQNVQDAVTRLGVTWPVVQDNEYKTWNAFSNQYWPNEFLIDIDGYVVHNHAGEGEYDVTEKAIQNALAERAARMGTSTNMDTAVVQLSQQSLDAIQSPETYFGANRNEYLANGKQGAVGVQTLGIPATEQQNSLYLGGTWSFAPEYAQNSGTATIDYTYNSHDIYFVASAATPVTIQVLRDGTPLGQFAGADVNSKTSTATIHEQRLYKLIHDPTPGVHKIEIKIMQSGLQAYTFTFG